MIESPKSKLPWTECSAIGQELLQTKGYLLVLVTSGPKPTDRDFFRLESEEAWKDFQENRLVGEQITLFTQVQLIYEGILDSDFRDHFGSQLPAEEKMWLAWLPRPNWESMRWYYVDEPFDRKDLMNREFLQEVLVYEAPVWWKENSNLLIFAEVT